MAITIYTTTTCPYCKKAAAYLTERGQVFETKNVAEDLVAQEEMVQKSGQLGVPVLDIGGSIVVGFDPAAIDAALNK